MNCVILQWAQVRHTNGAAVAHEGEHAGSPLRPGEGSGEEQWSSPVERSSRWRRVLPAVALVMVGIALIAGRGTDEADPSDGLAVTQQADDPSGRPGANAEPDDPEPLARTRERVDQLPGAAGVLFAVTRNSLARVDLATGARTVRELPGVAHETDASLIITDEKVVVIRSHSSVLALNRDLEGDPVQLYSHPPHDTDEEWWPVRAFHASGDTVTLIVGATDGHFTLQTITVTDGELVAVDRLPIEPWVVHLTGRTVVLGLAGEIFRYDLDAERGERLATGTPVAADDRQLVYTRCKADLSCDLLRRRFRDDTSHRIGASPSGYFSGSESLSPDGRWLAYATHEPEDSALLDLDSGTVLPLPDAPPRDRPYGFDLDKAVWTPDSAWLLMPDVSGVWAWRPGSAEVVDLRLGTTRIDGIAVAP